MLQEAAELVVEDMLECGEEIPNGAPGLSGLEAESEDARRLDLMR